MIDEHRWLHEGPWIKIVLVLAVLLIVFTKGPPEAPVISLPSEPVILPLLIFVGAIIVYSWWYGGNDHEEEEITYPDGVRFWYRESQEKLEENIKDE